MKKKLEQIFVCYNASAYQEYPALSDIRIAFDSEEKAIAWCDEEKKKYGIADIGYRKVELS